jgi:hypothetical protein
MFETVTTRRSFIALAALVAGASLASCGDDVPASRAPDGGAGTRADVAPEAAQPPEEAAKAPVGLANGRHAVFGLRMPQGMVPQGTPTPGVYRFEGPHPFGLVKTFLTEQLASFDPPAAEADAELIRNAVLRKPIGGGAAEPLAIRLYKKQAGTALDVWLEREEDAAGTAPGATPWPGGGAFGGQTAQAPQREKPSGAYGTPEERRRAVFEMLQKIERGEPLTKQDLDNPLFQ